MKTRILNLLSNFLESEDFYKDFKLYAKLVFEELKYKEAQKPIIEAQKAKAKEFPEKKHRILK